MKIYKTAVRSGDNVFKADTIEYEGSFWIVLEWSEDLAEGTMQPERMIRVSEPEFHPSDVDEFDFALDDSIPKAVLEGKKNGRFDVLVRPDIRFDNQEPSSLQ